MDGNGDFHPPFFSCIDLVHHLIETTIYTWMAIRFGWKGFKVQGGGESLNHLTATWMSQEVGKWLGSMGYNPNIPHL